MANVKTVDDIRTWL